MRQRQQEQFVRCHHDGSSGAATTAAGAATTAAGGAATTAASAAGCTVGVSWNNYQEERWAKWDEPAIKKALEAGGAKYISNDAKSSAETQASNVENLISQGAKVLIILAQDGTAIKPSVAKAAQAGVPVIAYDRLIEDPQVLYLTFDNKLVGQMQAEALFKLAPKGNWAIIKGNKADANADFLRSGSEEVIGAAVKSGDIKIVGEQYTDNWEASKAQTEMEQILTAANNDVQAALVQNDGMAGGAVAALQAQGLAGKVPVSGQDGDKAALNRVALGTQTVDVWKDSRQLGDGCRQGCAPALRGRQAGRRDRRLAVHHTGWQHPGDHPVEAPADHQGQPQRRPRRRLDHQGRPVQGRARPGPCRPAADPSHQTIARWSQRAIALRLAPRSRLRTGGKSVPEQPRPGGRDE